MQYTKLTHRRVEDWRGSLQLFLKFKKIFKLFLKMRYCRGYTQRNNFLTLEELCLVPLQINVKKNIILCTFIQYYESV